MNKFQVEIKKKDRHEWLTAYYRQNTDSDLSPFVRKISESQTDQFAALHILCGG